MEGDDRGKEIGTQPVGRRLSAGNPPVEVGVGKIEQGLESDEIRFVQSQEPRVGETPENEIHLAHAASPGTEMDPSPAGFKTVFGGIGHRRGSQRGTGIRRRADRAARRCDAAIAAMGGNVRALMG